MRITFEIETDNDAFGETEAQKSQEALQLVKTLLSNVYDATDLDDLPIMDYYGNRVGEVKVTA